MLTGGARAATIHASFSTDRQSPCTAQTAFRTQENPVWKQAALGFFPFSAFRANKPSADAERTAPTRFKRRSPSTPSSASAPPAFATSAGSGKAPKCTNILMKNQIVP